MKTREFRVILASILILGLLFAFAGCGGQDASKVPASEQKQEQSATEKPAAQEPAKKDESTKAETAKQATDPNAELAKLATQVLKKGPDGEDPVAADDIKVTDEEIAKLKSMKLKAAISLHYGGNDWSNTQVEGMKYQFGLMGIDVIAITDANFKPDKQASDIETILSKKPDILVSIPNDPVALAPVFKKAVEQGVKVVYMSQRTTGAKYKQDYVTIVSPDDLANGAIAAHIMAREMGGKGKIGIIFHGADYPTTKDRYDGFKKTIQEKYPEITIAAEQGIVGPDFTGDAEKVAAAFLTRDKDIKAIWGVWDVPAEGIMAAARTAGRDKDLIITTEDLGKNMAIDMLQGGMIKGLGAQLVFDMGVAQAKAGALAMLGKELPSFIVTKGLAVDKNNVLEAWKKVYHVDPPQEILDAKK